MRSTVHSHFIQLSQIHCKFVHILLLNQNWGCWRGIHLNFCFPLLCLGGESSWRDHCSLSFDSLLTNYTLSIVTFFLICCISFVGMENHYVLRHKSTDTQCSSKTSWISVWMNRSLAFLSSVQFEACLMSCLAARNRKGKWNLFPFQQEF